MNKPIGLTLSLILLLPLFVTVAPVTAESDIGEKIDSLFVIASSGEVMYRDMTEPAMDSIAALGAPAVPFLVEKFATKSARERWTVIWILQRIGSPAVPFLITSLNRPEHLIVQRVCWALGDIGDTAAVEPLLGIAGHARWQVRDQSVGALGKIGDKRAGTAVTRALDDPIGQVRKAAVVAAGQLGMDEVIPKLVHAFGDDFYGARMAAVDALHKLDTVRVLEVLYDSAASERDMVGSIVSSMLGGYATDQAIDILNEQARNGATPNRRAHAAVALAIADPWDNCGYMEEILKTESDRLIRLKIHSAIRTARNEQEEPSK